MHQNKPASMVDYAPDILVCFRDAKAVTSSGLRAASGLTHSQFNPERGAQGCAFLLHVWPEILFHEDQGRDA